MIQAPEFWVAIAFVVFMAALWKKIVATVGSALDARAEKIRAELEEAEDLRRQAQATLEASRQHQAEALREAEAILVHARGEALRIHDQAIHDLEESLRRREAQAKDRIAQAEAQALIDIRNLTVDIAISTSRRVLDQTITPAQADILVDQAIADLPKALH